MDIKTLSEDIKKFEPRTALDGGNDGLDLIKKIIYKSKKILKINGTLALEIGYEQINKVSKILLNNKFKIKYIIKDYTVEDKTGKIIDRLPKKKKVNGFMFS